MKQNRGGRILKLTTLAAGMALSACGGGSGSSGGLLQVITFDYPGGVTLAAGPAKLKATSSSGLPVSFKSGTPTVCTVAGDQLSLLVEGECLVYADQAGGQGPDGKTWAPADEVSQLFKVLKHPQVVTFTPPDYVLSATTKSIEISAKAESGLPVTFATTTPEVCSITGSTLQVKAKGSCNVTASQAGDANYLPQTTQRFIAVDPLVLADGFAPPGTAGGSTNSLSTKQGGGVSVNSWNVGFSNWEWCEPTDGNWCYHTISEDGSSLLSALHVPEANIQGWYAPFNRIEIFGPQLKGFNGSGDTNSGLRVTTEKVLAFTLGVNKPLYNAMRPIVVHLDLGKRNGGCNPTISAHLWPSGAGLVSYGIPLSEFAVTQACGIAGVDSTSLDNVRKVPSPWPTAATPDAAAKHQQALDAIASARTAATSLLAASDIVRVRIHLMDGNKDRKPVDTDVPPPTAVEKTYFASDLTVKGAITVQ